VWIRGRSDILLTKRCCHASLVVIHLIVLKLCKHTVTRLDNLVLVSLCFLRQKWHNGMVGTGKERGIKCMGGGRCCERHDRMSGLN
jgi:hypothetical protein